MHPELFHRMRKHPAIILAFACTLLGCDPSNAGPSKSQADPAPVKRDVGDSIVRTTRQGDTIVVIDRARESVAFGPLLLGMDGDSARTLVPRIAEEGGQIRIGRSLFTPKLGIDKLDNTLVQVEFISEKYRASYDSWNSPGPVVGYVHYLRDLIIKQYGTTDDGYDPTNWLENRGLGSWPRNTGDFRYNQYEWTVGEKWIGIDFERKNGEYWCILSIRSLTKMKEYRTREYKVDSTAATKL